MTKAYSLPTGTAAIFMLFLLLSACTARVCAGDLICSYVFGNASPTNTAQFVTASDISDGGAGLRKYDSSEGRMAGTASGLPCGQFDLRSAKDENRNYFQLSLTPDDMKYIRLDSVSFYAADLAFNYTYVEITASTEDGLEHAVAITDNIPNLSTPGWQLKKITLDLSAAETLQRIEKETVITFKIRNGSTSNPFNILMCVDDISFYGEMGDIPFGGTSILAR